MSIRPASLSTNRPISLAHLSEIFARYNLVLMDFEDLETGETVIEIGCLKDPDLPDDFLPTDPIYHIESLGLLKDHAPLIKLLEGDRLKTPPFGVPVLKKEI